MPNIVLYIGRVYFYERGFLMKGGTYLIVVFGILLAKCMGFLRDIVFASAFGASYLTDIYFQIFGVASLIFTGIGGALSTLVIKNLNKPCRTSEADKREYVASFITKTSLITIAATILLYIFAGSVVRLLLPGIKDEMYKSALGIMYIMLPSCLFVIIAYIMSGVLQNSKVFFITSVMSLPYNVIIISSLFIKNVSIEAVSIATTIGWFLHVAVLLPAFFKKGYKLFGKITSHEESDNNREVLYIFIGSMMFQLSFMIDKAALSFDSGMASSVNYATNLFITIASVFVVAMSNVSYPSLCRNYEEKNIDFVRHVLQYIITLLFAIFIPFILTVCLFGKEIISLLYQRGEFGAELTKTTATLFAVYSFGIFGYVCQELFNKVLYLGSKYKYTVGGTLIIVLAKPIINIFAVNLGGALAVAASTTIMFLIYAAGISCAMLKVVGNYLNRTLIFNILKIFLSSAVAFGVYFVLSFIVLPFAGGKIAFLFPLAACAAAYIITLTASGCVKYIIKNKDFSSDGSVNK